MKKFLLMLAVSALFASGTTSCGSAVASDDYSIAVDNPNEEVLLTSVEVEESTFIVSNYTDEAQYDFKSSPVTINLLEDGVSLDKVPISTPNTLYSTSEQIITIYPNRVLHSPYYNIGDTREIKRYIKRNKDKYKIGVAYIPTE